MASNICSTCLRTAFRQKNPISRGLRNATRLSTRSFTTPSRHFAAAESSYGSAAQIKEPHSNDQSTTASDLNKIQGGTLDTYAAYGATEILYKECAGQAPYSIPKVKDGEEVPHLENGTQLGVGEGWWYEELGLQPTFTSWTQVTMLHMYLIAVRLRCLSPEVCKTWQQHFTDHFFTDAENRMIVNHDLQSRGARNGYLKDLFLQWRGILLAYDEGLVKGDAVLAAAVWRNLFNADPEVDFRRLAEIVAFMRRALRELEEMGDLGLAKGEVRFGGPGEEGVLVGRRSKLLDLPLEQAPGKPQVAEKKSA